MSERGGKNKKEKREEYDQNIKNTKGPRLRYERKWTEKKVRRGAQSERREIPNKTLGLSIHTSFKAKL